MKFIREILILIAIFLKVRKINRKLSTIKTDDIILRTVDHVRQKIYKYHNNVVSNLIVEHEKEIKRTISDIKKVHEIKINRMKIDHENEINMYKEMISEIKKDRDKIAKDNHDVVSFFTELVPRMTIIKEKESALCEEDRLRRASKSQRQLEISDEWGVLNRIIRKNEKKLNNITKDAKVYEFLSNKG